MLFLLEARIRKENNTTRVMSSDVTIVHVVYFSVYYETFAVAGAGAVPWEV